MTNWKALTLAALVLTAACESTTSTSEVATTTWALKSFDLAGGQTVPVSRPEQYTLQLGSGDRAHVRADCNVCNGNYRISGTTLDFGLMACTRAACPPESLDGEYLRALDSASSFEISPAELSIRYPDGVLRFGPT